MRYRSTRDPSSTFLSFEEALFTGLAPDGGLYIPENIPLVSPAQLCEWKDLSFPILASKIFRLYISLDEISDEELIPLLLKSFSTFSHPEVTPLKSLNNDNMYLLELFHGPTFAFKDVALQVLGM